MGGPGTNDDESRDTDCDVTDVQDFKGRGVLGSGNAVREFESEEVFG